MYDYYIVATYDMGNGKRSDCLVCLAGHTAESAEHSRQMVLDGIANGKKEYAKIVGNVRIEYDKHEDCWWNQGGLD